ncbi:MAG: acylphosphatase [Clostridiales bacterium]|nr:acylphosphatase [Clostridiales bacterium]
MEIIRRHFLFSGRVQGVGFRYRAYYIARSLGLTGWVRNLWDERVEMEVQGTREAVEQMPVMLGKQPYIWIDNVESRDIPPVAEIGFERR